MDLSKYEHVNLHMTDIVHYKAEWSIVGFKENGVTYGIVASKSLSAAQLEAHLTHKDIHMFDSQHVKVDPPDIIFISKQTMNDYVMVRGRSYAECLARLMENWEPSEEVTEVEFYPAFPQEENK